MAEGLHPVQQNPYEQRLLYPLLQRTRGYQAWRPVVGVIVLVVGGVLLIPTVLQLVVLEPALIIQGGTGSLQQRALAAAAEKVVTPAAFLYLNLSLAAVVLVAWLVQRVLHGLSPRWLMSVRPGIRWRFLAVCLGLSVVAIVVSQIVGSVLPISSAPATNGGNVSDGHLHALTGQGVAFIVLVLITTPLQAMGEEYGFRGYLMQALGGLTDAVAGGWIRRRDVREKVAVGVALVVTAGLFALAHGAQNFPLFFDRFAFGLLAGYLVVRTGGLEAGIALHALNNIVAFGFAIAYQHMTQALTETSASSWNIVLTVVQNGLYLILVIVVARRMGLDNRSRPPVLVQQTAAV